MINSDLSGGVTGHHFRMCCFVLTKQHDLSAAAVGRQVGTRRNTIYGAPVSYRSHDMLIIHRKGVRVG